MLARYGMYRITIHQIERVEAQPPASNTTMNIDTELYSQLFENLDVSDLIARINHKPRRQRAKQKGTGK